jgi:hypothetical protein
MMARRVLPRAMDTSFAAETYDTLRAIPFPTLTARRRSGKRIRSHGPPFFSVMKNEFYDSSF